MTWKQQTLVLLLTETDQGAEADLFRVAGASGPAGFRKDVLKPLHKTRQVEYDAAKRTARLLPPGLAVAEALTQRSPDARRDPI